MFSRRCIQTAVRFSKREDFIQSCSTLQWRSFTTERNTAGSPQETSTQNTSARSQFKQLPVNPSILKYIESIGVGIPKRKKPWRKKRATPTDGTNFTTGTNTAPPPHQQKLDRRPKKPVSLPPPPPFPTSLRESDTDNGTVVHRMPVKLLGRVGSIKEAFPKATPNLPEIAIAGRSNVGKSTLLNALLHGTVEKTEEEEKKNHRSRGKRPTSWTAKLPKGIKASTSARPGETRQLSFYQLSAKITSFPDATEESKGKPFKRTASLMLVDLPGYGFAYATEEKAREWQLLMKSFLLERGNSLKRILLLLDSRHGMKQADVEFLLNLQQSLREIDPKRDLPPIQVVLTKCDLVSQADLARRVELVRKEVSDCLVRQPSALPIQLVSAQVDSQAGVRELQRELASLIPSHKK